MQLAPILHSHSAQCHGEKTVTQDHKNIATGRTHATQPNSRYFLEPTNIPGRLCWFFSGWLAVAGGWKEGAG